MPAISACRDEIEALHDFFVKWYGGTVERSAFDRMERTIGPEFEMVTPDGVRHDRSTVLKGVRDSYGHNKPGDFDIEIRNVELIEHLGSYAVVRYEEWQTSAEERTGRVSTVLLCEQMDAPGGLEWIDLHETWLEH